jgi:prophage regulatory protein
MANEGPVLRQFLRLPKVEAAVGKRRSWIYWAMNNGQFPRSIKLGSTSVWDAAEIAEWQQARIAERNAVCV